MRNKTLSRLVISATLLLLSTTLLLLAVYTQIHDDTAQNLHVVGIMALFGMMMFGIDFMFSFREYRKER